MGYQQDDDLYALPSIQLRNINFSGSYLFGADFSGAEFTNCNFSDAGLGNVSFGNNQRQGCNFSDASINGGPTFDGVSIFELDSKQLQSTWSYKNKTLCKTSLSEADYRGLDFSGFNLSHTTFDRCRLTDCNFTDADITGLSIQIVSNMDENVLRHVGEVYPDMPPPDNWRSAMFPENLPDLIVKIEQLLSTKNFKMGFVHQVRVDYITWPDHVVDFSNMVFIDCCFGISPVLAKIDLTDSVISGCNFRVFRGLTLENVKSTWNYKHGRMEGIKLPESIQKSLDAEKEKQ